MELLGVPSSKHFLNLAFYPDIYVKCVKIKAQNQLWHSYKSVNFTQSQPITSSPLVNSRGPISGQHRHLQQSREETSTAKAQHQYIPRVQSSLPQYLVRFRFHLLFFAPLIFGFVRTRDPNQSICMSRSRRRFVIISDISRNTYVRIETIKRVSLNSVDAQLRPGLDDRKSSGDYATDRQRLI